MFLCKMCSNEYNILIRKVSINLMVSVVFRYGSLLALFLIVLEITQRSYITRLLSYELYSGLIAVM